MIIYSELKKFFKTQANLASVIGGGEVTRASRTKAHRIWKGVRKPSDEEMLFIYQATNGSFDANYFSGLLLPKKSKKSRTN